MVLILNDLLDFNYSMLKLKFYFKYSIIMGRNNYLKDSVAYLGLDNLTVKFFELESYLVDNNQRNNEENITTILLISCVLAAILLGVMTIFLYKNLKRPPRPPKFFDYYYRARKAGELIEYSRQF